MILYAITGHAAAARIAEKGQGVTYGGEWNSILIFIDILLDLL